MRKPFEDEIMARWSSSEKLWMLEGMRGHRRNCRTRADKPGPRFAPRLRTRPLQKPGKMKGFRHFSLLHLSVPRRSLPP